MARGKDRNALTDQIRANNSIARALRLTIEKEKERRRLANQPEPETGTPSFNRNGDITPFDRT